MPKHNSHFPELLKVYRERAFELSEKYQHNPAFRNFTAEMNRLESMAKALNGLHKARDPRMTEEAHLAKTAKQAERLRSEIAKASERVVNLQKSAVSELEQRINEKAGLRDSPHGAEVRAVLRGMDASDRAKAVRQMMRDESAPELMGAILNAPTVLTGLNDDLRSRYREQYLETRAPEEHAELNGLFKVIGDVHSLISRADQWAQDVQGDPSKLAEIERAEAAAAEAEQALNAAMG